MGSPEIDPRTGKSLPQVSVGKVTTKGSPVIVGVQPSTTLLDDIYKFTVIGLTGFNVLLGSDPNIIWMCVANWYAESKYKQIWGGGVSDGTARGLTRVDGGSGNSTPTPTRGSGAYQYWNSSVIQTRIRAVGPNDPGLIDGLYAFGISQTMGWYFINTGGSPYTDIFGGAYKNVASKFSQSLAPYLNFNLQPGQRVTTLFPDTENGWQASIIAGLAVLESKYNSYVGKRTTGKGGLSQAAIVTLAALNEPFVPGTPLTPHQALDLAFASYLGLSVKGDANGSKGVDRARWIRNNANKATLSGFVISNSGVITSTSGNAAQSNCLN